MSTRKSDEVFHDDYDSGNPMSPPREDQVDKHDADLKPGFGPAGESDSDDSDSKDPFASLS
jgi:hypothetical protein